MNAHDFKQWLQAKMGLDADTIGPGVVDRAVRERMAALGSAGRGDYWEALRGCLREQQALIEAVIVPETWFYRDREAFAALAQHFGPAWAASHPGATLRLLSLPCSTGEEPYTMAMALLQAGLPAVQLHIDAVDISERALARARAGLYGTNSFRGADLSFREHYFQALPGGWQIAPELRACVHFLHGNVLDPDFLPGQAGYDAIFCRNLLIYFDPDTQRRTVRVLERLLQPDGLLFVGPAETGLMLGEGHVSAQLPMAFAFRAPTASASGTATAAPVVPSPARVVNTATRPPLCAAPSAPAPTTPAARPDLAATPAAPAGAGALDEAQRLADDGRFEQAQQACQAHLQAHGPSARALTLMGLIHGARGERVRAEAYFRKALYLEPDHEETLMHLALLLETQGDAAAGRVLRARAHRLRLRQTAG